MKKVFIQLCKDFNIECNLNKFYAFCTKASFFNANYDKRFYQFAPLELRHRPSYSIVEMFKKFNDWNGGKKYFKVYDREFPEYDSIEIAQNANQAKYKFAKENRIEYSKLGCSVSYSDCL